MNKKGFTLIELLGVLILLAVIALITFPIIDKVLSNAKNQAYERQKDSIIEAASLYVTVNGNYSTSTKQLSFQTLIDAGFLKEGEILDPRDSSKEMPGCVLYSWSESKNQYIFEYSEECEVPLFPGSLTNILLTQYTEGNTTGLVKDTSNQNLYYYKGTNEEVENNFLWYGGHQWRVLEFDNSEKTLTLITQQPLTAILPSNPWTNEEKYDNSYVNTWLNEYFWNSLDNSIKSSILDNTFNVGIYTDVDEITTTKKVGLLDQTQYERAGEQDSYLDIKDNWWLGNRASSSGVYSVNSNGNFSSRSVADAYGVRAVIKISDITITGGDGTLSNNYKVANKATDTSDVQVGEYINVPYIGSDNACGSDDMCTFRVVSKDNDSIKVVLNGLLLTTNTYGSSATITTSHTIYTSLNTFAAGISDTYRYTGTKIFYIDDYSSSSSYKAVKYETLEASVGLPTVGEMFSGNDIDLGSPKTFVDVNTIENPTVSDRYWTMNRYSSSSVRNVSDTGQLYSYSFTDSYGIRAVIYLNSGITFTGGEGTAQNPYILSMN